MKNIFDFKQEKLEGEFEKNSFPKYRVKQVYNFLYINLVSDFDSMYTLPQELILYLKNSYSLGTIKENIKQVSTDGTEKVLLELSDGEKIETVLMKYKHGYTVCVTTQIGCKIGCSFCASHRGGFIRNLSSGEIVEQVVYWNRYLKRRNSRVSNIVVMGIGEPLDNIDNVLEFIDIINDKIGFNIGARKITISTSGIAPKMDRLIKYDKQINLAVSIHAPNNELRSKIMKINDTYSIEDIMKKIDEYLEKTNRQVTFEYIMLKHVNDSKEEALELAKVIGKKDIHVNLIPYNTVFETEYGKSSIEIMDDFQKVLTDNSISSTIRAQKGNDIDGACGQLRNKKG